MRMYYFDLRRIFKGALIFTIAAITLLVGYGLLKDNLALPTSKPYDPIRQGFTKDKQIALTVNVVWGEEYLPQMLEIMRQNEVKATFYVGGQFAEKFPKLVKAIAKDGHEIGNHGYSHPHPNAISREKNLEEITKTQDIIYKLTKVKTKLFAPPYGEYNDAVLQVAHDAKHQTVLWSIDTVDWKRPAPEIIVNRVIKRLHNGAIVLMHPTEPTVKALPKLIKDLKSEGYKFSTVSKIIK